MAVQDAQQPAVVSFEGCAQILRSRLVLAQSLAGPLLNASYTSRGYETPPTVSIEGSTSGPPVEVSCLRFALQGQPSEC
jgi:hypothetical protein